MDQDLRLEFNKKKHNQMDLLLCLQMFISLKVDRQISSAYS